MSQVGSATSTSFDSAVVERSHRQPVVVDFWAPWCGPCHQLSPLLERAAERFAPDVSVVKVNVDESPDVAQRYRIQGIPAVKAFRDGDVVSEFTGVRPESEIERFFAALVPSEADRLVAAAAEDPDPEARLREALKAEPGHAGAITALAEMLLDRGQTDEAGSLLDRVHGDPAVDRLRAQVAMAARRVDDDELARLRAAAAGGDPQAQLALGRALASVGAYEQALEALLAAVTDPATREEARQAVLETFDVLGADHDLVRTTRPRLASALYA